MWHIGTTKQMALHDSVSGDHLSSQQLQKVTVAYTNQPCRRKLQFINGKFAVQKPQTSTVQKRNERERNRVKLINRTFSTLRDCLPPKYAGKKAKKLSKVDVLKTATAYIAHLARLLSEDACSRQQQQQQQQPPQPCLSYQQHQRLEASLSESADASCAVSSVDYQRQQLQHQLTSSLGVYCDLSVLLDDSSASHLQQQQQHPCQAVQPQVSDEGDNEAESGVFQLSSEANSSSSSPWMMQQLLPVAPPAAAVSCFTFSTPIKPTDDVAAALCFYPTASAVTTEATNGQPELQVLSMSDISEGCNYLQFI